MNNKKTKRLIVEKYVKENNKKKQSLSNTDLARVIFSENTNLYDSVESIRLIIRRVKGQHGERNRKKASDRSLFSEALSSNKSVREQQLRGVEIFKDSKKLPKVLLLDIETLPMVCRTWGLIKSYMQHDDIIKDWCIVSWSAKWLFDHNIMGAVLTSKEAIDRDDSRIVKSIWKLVNDADVIIAHNGLRFDFVKLNTRFILNGLTPPNPYQTIDTLAIVKKNGTGFAFSSNRLDYLGKLVRNKGKIETNKKLWIDCDNGDKEALKKMLEYNKEDVLLLEEVYIYIRAWIKSHPNMALFMMDNDYRDCCCNCGSEEIKWNGGFYTTPAGKYSTYRCKSCGAIGRIKVSALNKKQRDKLNIPTAR